MTTTVCEYINYGQDDAEMHVCPVLKFCRICEQMKDLDTEFRPNNNVCRLCRNAICKAWRIANPYQTRLIRKRHTVKKRKTCHGVPVNDEGTEGGHDYVDGVRPVQ